MTRRTPSLLAILAVCIVALFATRSNADEQVIELTNTDVLAYQQPCYHRDTTRVIETGGVTTWCDVRMNEEPGVITCTSVAEPTYCSE